MPKKESIIRLNGRELIVEIHRRKGSRHLRMGLTKRNQLRVSAPWHCSDRAIWKFVEQQEEWIGRQLKQAPKNLSVSDYLMQNPRLSASGQIFSVRIDRDSEKPKDRFYFAKESDELIFVWSRDSDETSFVGLVRSFAKDALQCRLLHHCNELGVALPVLTVRDQVSRWGSCSSTGRISLNWRLVLLETELQDYVILHELAHLKEMNHSSRFWSLLDQYDPNRREHERALDLCTPTIMRVGR